MAVAVLRSGTAVTSRLENSAAEVVNDCGTRGGGRGGPLRGAGCRTLRPRCRGSAFRKAGEQGRVAGRWLAARGPPSGTVR